MKNLKKENPKNLESMKFQVISLIYMNTKIEKI